ncbi:hypothetical protein DFJ74DRAFT_27952 [Hyaloraphidium curvatum]|nr:hypothetical protein DFJ74DRAFT_27952 [Hyaloraphidium curvatum]
MQAVLAGEGSYQFRVRGSPSLVPVATMEMQAGTIESKRTAAAALVIEAGTFSSISTLLTALGSEDMNFNAVPVAPSNAGTAVFAILSYSSVDLNSNADWKWTTPSLAQETSITKGLTVAADFGFPADCKGDSICITFRGLLGSARLRAAIRVKSDEFAASAAVVNLKINDDWMLNKVGFELVLGKKTRLAFTGEMSVKVDAKQSLTFGVEVAAIFTPPKVELKGYMVGMWSNAFGIPRFAVGNIVVAMGVTATSPILGLPMPAFTVGGEIAIGPQPCYANDLPPPRTFRCTDWTEAEIKQVLDPNADRANGGPGSTERLMCARDKARSYYEDRSTSPCGCRCCMLVASKPRTKCISGSGYVGIDPQNPDNNWFGIKMRNIVLQSIFDAFVDGAVTLPSVLAETGFPGILTASYSMISEQEPVPGIVFPRGINIKGAFNMFGYKGKAEIAVDPTNGFLVDVSAAPLTIGGDILILAKNRSALNEGPFVYIDARGQKMVLPTIQGSAFISLFGGVVSVSFSCASVRTRTLKRTPQQSVIVDIVMPNRLKLFLEREFFGLSARANISADLSLKGWPSMGVGAYVEFAGLDVAQKFVSKVLAQISAWCQDGVRKLGEAQASVERARGDVSRTLLSVCRKDQCVKEVKEYWGCTSWAMQIKCPEPSPCPWWDLFCHGKNFISGMCELVKQIIIWICRAWDTIREVISDAICDVGCAAARVANEVAQVGMTVAQGVLEVAKGVADIASKVLDAIAKALNFFTISMMSAGFDFRISGATAAAGRFYCDIRGELASRPWTVGFEVDLGDLLGTASRLFLASIKPVLTSVFGRRRQLERTLPYSPFSDTSPALADPHDPLPEIRAVLADPAVRALLAGAKMYRGVGALGGANVTVDLQFVPEGVDGFLAHAGEFRGDIPHRNKWDEGRRRNRKRSEVPTLWTRDPLEGEAYVRYLEDSLGI